MRPFTRFPVLVFPLLVGLGVSVGIGLPAPPPVSGAEGASEDARGAQRRMMVETVRRELEETRRRTGNERVDPAVLEAMVDVPRHRFVPERMREYAYRNRPLPIGHGQTISQPYIVALMTDLAAVGADDTVLEVGTGSAYQAAVLAELVETVYTIEIVPELAASAAARLEELGYDNVQAREGDGYFGWPEHAPFDAIVVTAASSHVPPPLIEQLAEGGTMVIPVGSPFATQQLMVVKKDKDGEIQTRQVLPVAFVPLTRDETREKAGDDAPDRGGDGRR